MRLFAAKFGYIGERKTKLSSNNSVRMYINPNSLQYGAMKIIRTAIIFRS